MKKVNDLVKFVILVLLEMVVVYSLVSPVDAAQIKFKESPDVTIIDSNGEYLSGRPINQTKKLIPIKYRGTSFSKDIKDGTGSMFDGKDIKPGTVIKVNNVGYYNGKQLVLAIKSSVLLRIFYKDTNLEEGFGLTRVNYPADEADYDIWIEDSSGNKLADDTINLLFPLIVYPNNNVANSADNKLSIAYNQGIDNILVLDSSNLKNFSLDKTNNAVFDIYVTSDSKVMATINYVYPPSTDPFKLKVNLTTMASQRFFYYKDETLLLPLKNPRPEINKTQNDESTKVKIDISQLLIQKVFDNHYSDPFEIHIQLPNIVQMNNKLRIIDDKQQDITDKATVSSLDKRLDISLPKTFLKELKDNTIRIQADFDIERDTKELIKYYQPDGYFHVPIQAKNNENSKESTGYSLIKMPEPTGEAIPQSVALNSSTKDLVASKLVKNLKSLLPSDTISILGFVEEKSFTVLGDTEVYINIKSDLTGKEGRIKVPIKVVNQSKLIVNFVDEKDQSLQEAYVKTELVGQKIDLSQITEVTDRLLKLKNANYLLTKKPTNEVITIAEDGNTYTYQFTGMLKLVSAPSSFDFDIQKVQLDAIRFTEPKIIGQPLVVSDTRADKKMWQLKVKVEQPLMNLENAQLTLPDAIKYKYAENEFVLTNESSVIFSFVHAASGTYDVSKERWTKGDGFLLDIAPGAIKALGKYQAKITIALENAK